MRHRALILLCTLAAVFATTASAHAAPKVVASIKPLHSLVAAVMDGVGEPGLIVGGGASPHTYSLKPSDAAALEQADLVFWFGEELETFLAKPLRTLGTGSRSAALLEEAPIERLPAREDSLWEAHPGEHGHEAEDGQDHHGHGHDDHGAFDAHVWLDPRNAKRIVETVAARLAEVDPANAGRYAANAAEVSARLDALDRELDAMLDPVSGKPFVVFHDAYRHLEDRYGLNAVGALTVSPDRPPSARHLAEIRDALRARGVVCVFAEPQQDSKLIDAVAEGVSLRRGILDPEGAARDEGPDLYFDLMRANGRALADCLGG